MNIHDKYKVLQQNLKAMGSVAVAFSSVWILLSC